MAATRIHRSYDVRELRQPAVEEVAAPGEDDDRQLLRTCPVENVGERPLLSINRGFSAPVIVHAERGAGDLEALAGADTDPFARYEALQELMLRTIIGRAEGEAVDFAPVVGAVAATLQSNALDPAFKAEGAVGAARFASGKGRHGNFRDI